MKDIFDLNIEFVGNFMADLAKGEKPAYKFYACKPVTVRDFPRPGDIITTITRRTMRLYKRGNDYVGVLTVTEQETANFSEPFFRVKSYMRVRTGGKVRRYNASRVWNSIYRPAWTREAEKVLAWGEGG